MIFSFPTLNLEDWQASRDALQTDAQFISKIRSVLTPKQPHRWHTTLHTTALGLTTTPIAANGLIFEMRLDLLANLLVLVTYRGDIWQKPLRGLSAAHLYSDGMEVLGELGIQPPLDSSLFSRQKPPVYDETAVHRYCQVLLQIEAVFKQFAGQLTGKISPVQFWPQPFHLAVSWFSGRVLPQSPTEQELIEECIHFGFSTGDIDLPEPYFYVTCDPLLPLEIPLPPDAFWNSRGFQGIVLRYASLKTSHHPSETLFHFLQTLQQSIAVTMQQ
jgi:hypothetical protein